MARPPAHSRETVMAVVSASPSISSAARALGFSHPTLRRRLCSYGEEGVALHAETARNGQVRRHVLSAIDPVARTAVCLQCGPVKIRRRAASDQGHGWRCVKGSPRGGDGRSEYRWFAGGTCERCGFVAEDSCQIDVHHVDGNHGNNDRGNLQSLCANCHRIVTKRQMEKPTNL